MLSRKLTILVASVLAFLLAGCGGGDADQTASDAFEPMVSPSGLFTVQVPSGWEDSAGQDPRCGSALVCLVGGDFILQMEEADIGSTNDLSAYVNLIMSDRISVSDGLELVSQSAVATDDGLTAVMTEFTFQGGLVRSTEYWVLAGDQVLVIGYSGFAAGFDAIRETAEYTFRTIQAVE